MLPAALAAFGACRWSPHESATGLCKTLDALQRSGRLQNDTLFVDVGAARAYQSLVARRYGHPVLAFECRSDEIARLQANTAFARDPHITLMPVCVSDHAGIAKLHHAEDSSSLEKSAVSHGIEARKARRDPLHEAKRMCPGGVVGGRSPTYLECLTGTAPPLGSRDGCH